MLISSMLPSKRTQAGDDVRNGRLIRENCSVNSLMNEDEQKMVFVIERPMMSAEDSKNLQIMKDIAVRNDYESGNKWFTAEYLDAASRRNGGWSPLFGVFVISSSWAIMGSEVLAFFVFWITILTGLFVVSLVVCWKINDFIINVVFELPHFRFFAFWSIALWVLFHVAGFYLKN